MDAGKIQYAGLKWMIEQDLVNDPQLINQVKMNVLMTSKRVKEVELLIYREKKSMLVLLELSWIGRTFFKKSIFADVEDILNQMLPSFRFRVTTDPKIMDLAVELVKVALGGRNEKLKTSDVRSTSVDVQPGNDDKQTEDTSKVIEGSSIDPISDPQEQPKIDASVQFNVGTNDSDEL